MGSTVLILGIEDAFHLVSQVIHSFGSGDYTAWRGFGKLITAVTMRVFYLLMYRLWIRVILFLFPGRCFGSQNELDEQIAKRYNNLRLEFKPHLLYN